MKLIQNKQYRLITILMIVLLLAPCFCFSQNTFLKVFGGTSMDEALGGCAANSGYYMVGYSSSFGNGQEGYVMRLNDRGNILWSRTIGSTANDKLTGAIATSDNGVIVVGEYTNGDQNALAVRLDSSGNVIWARVFGAVGMDGFTNISKNSQDEYVIAGYTESHNPGGLRDAMTVKINEFGNLIWARTFGGYQNDWGEQIIENNFGYYFACNTFSYGSGQQDAMFVRITPQGGMTNVQMFGTSSDEHFTTVTTLNNGDAVFSGYVTQLGKKRIWLARINLLGTIIWSKAYNFSGLEMTSKVITADDGNILVFGSELDNSNNGKVFISKINSSTGDIIWATEYGGNGSEEIYGYGQLPNGNIFAMGSTTSYGTGNKDFFILKTYPDGSIDSCFQLDITNQFLVNVHSPTSQFFTPSNQTALTNNSTNIAINTPPTIQTSICYFEPVTAIFEPNLDTICAGDCIQLINSSHNSDIYQWTFDGANTLISDQPAPNNICYSTPGVYTIQLIASNDTDSDTAYHQIIVQPTPEVDLGNDTTFCDVNNWILDAISNSDHTYIWQDSSNSFSFNAINTGQYQVTVSNIFGCTASDAIQLHFDFTPTLDLGNDTIICEGQQITFDITTNDANYIWNNGADSPTQIFSESGDYVATIQSGICEVSDTINVQVLAAPFIDLGIDTFICENDNILLDVFNDLAVSYQWQNGSSDPNFWVIEAGNYSVEVTYASGCIQTDSIQITPERTIDVTFAEDTSICKNKSIVLNAYHPNAKTYQWSGFSAYFGQNDLTDTSFIISKGGQYQVILNNGCRDYTYSIDVTEEDCGCYPFIPNGFSPNGDGENDIFKIYSNCTINDFEMKIFNRWGEIVFISTDETQGWDGLIRNQFAPNGIYVWMISYTALGENGHPAARIESGDLTLIR